MAVHMFKKPLRTYSQNVIETFQDKSILLKSQFLAKLEPQVVYDFQSNQNGLNYPKRLMNVSYLNVETSISMSNNMSWAARM